MSGSLAITLIRLDAAGKYRHPRYELADRLGDEPIHRLSKYHPVSLCQRLMSGGCLFYTMGAIFKQHNFVARLSVDERREMHDAYRFNKGGADSFDQVMRGPDYFKKNEEN